MKQSVSPLIFAVLFCLSIPLFSQTEFQTLRGVVRDKDSKEVLIGAHISIVDLPSDLAAISDFDGSFELQNVPVGRQRIQCSYIGYEDYISPSFIVNSAKVVFLEFELEASSVQLNDVVIIGAVNDDRTQNEMVLLSGRSFSAEETERYAGSIADPSRMSVGFAGVQATNDLDNDIVVRGNSSTGILWRLEGIDIPNPNHFARRGSSGGGISIFSVNMLRNSDFIYGAPPAEYGNVLSGVFDMKLRKGNNQNNEYSFRASLLGLDAVAEGPIKKGKGSFLANYRYSTLGLLNNMGVHVVDEDTDNNFSDLAFHLYLPSEDNKNIIQIWGLGGLSSEQHFPVDDQAEAKEFEDLVRTDFKSSMGVLGFNYTRLLENDAYVKLKSAIMADHITHNKDSIDMNFVQGYLSDESYNTNRLTAGIEFGQKLKDGLLLKSGLSIDLLGYELIYNEYDRAKAQYFEYLDAENSPATQQSIQLYSQFKWDINTSLTFNVGANLFYSTIAESMAINPRLAISYQLSSQSNLSLAYGHYSQMLPLGNYYVLENNKDLDFINSHQWILAWNTRLWDKFKISIESYYQKLKHVPVASDPAIHYWMFNDLVGYSNYALTDQGTGRNYGVDLTIERFFDKGLFFLASGSVYKSEYSTDGQNYYSSRYDGRYNSSFMIGKEFEINGRNMLQFSFRNLVYGGQWYASPDDDITARTREYYPDPSQANNMQVDAYWRSDIRISYRKNNSGNAWMIALDVQNMFNIENPRFEIWNIQANAYDWRNQAGIIPVISYQVDF